MSRKLSRKMNLVVPFFAAFAGMLVAIPVAVTASIMVAKATLGEEKSQLAHAVSELSRNYQERPLATPVSYKHEQGCVGDAEEIDTKKLKEDEEAKKPKIVYVPTRSQYTPATINNITHTNTTNTNTTNNIKNTTIQDSIITVTKTNTNNTVINDSLNVGSKNAPHADKPAGALSDTNDQTKGEKLDNPQTDTPDKK